MRVQNPALEPSIVRLARGAAVTVVLTAAGLLAGCASSLGPDLSPAVENSLGAEKPAAAVAVATDMAVRRQALAKAAAALTAAATPGSNVYKIGPQDVLDISVFQVPDLQRTVQVADSGTVNLPLLGDVQAVGMTAQQVERNLAKRLGAKYLQSPQVSVSVKEFNSQRITVDGAVQRPGVYPIRGRSSLLQMVSMAGGLTESSDEANIVVFRDNGGKRTAAGFDFAAIRAGSAEDPALQQGDVVVVNSSQFKEAFQNVLKALPLTRLFVPLL